MDYTDKTYKIVTTKDELEIKVTESFDPYSYNLDTEQNGVTDWWFTYNGQLFFRSLDKVDTDKAIAMLENDTWEDYDTLTSLKNMID